MRKKNIFLICILFLLFILSLFFLTLFRPANPKLHRLKIGQEKKILDIYRYKCEKILFIEGKNKQEKLEEYFDVVDIKESFEKNDILMLFMDKDRHAIGFPLHTYFDDLDREPFYDDILFLVPFEEELPKDCVFVKRQTRNSFRIEKK